MMLQISSAWRQKGLTGHCFKYIDRPFASELRMWYETPDAHVPNEALMFLFIVTSCRRQTLCSPNLTKNADTNE